MNLQDYLDGLGVAAFSAVIGAAWGFLTAVVLFEKRES